jgi:hypothetical protein
MSPDEAAPRYYVPAHIAQGDGSPCQWTNCWAAVGAWLARGATGGAKMPTPSRIRQLARAGGCRTGGLADVQLALQRLGITCHYRMDLDRYETRDILDRPGTLSQLSVAYDALPRRERCQAGEVDFYHAMGVVGGSLVRGQGWRVMDPLCRAIQRIEHDALFDAALAYGREHGDGQTIDLLTVQVPVRPTRSR